MTAPAGPLACPHCGSALREGAPWCTLCFADLRAPEQPVPPPAPVASAPVGPGRAAEYGLPAVDPLTAPLLDVVLPRLVPVERAPAVAPTVDAPGNVVASDDAVAGGAAAPVPTWPCTRCGAATPMSATACSGCGAGFLDAERLASAPVFVLPLVGDVLAMSRARRCVLAFGAVLALCVPLAVVTLLLTHSPASPTPTAPTGTTQVSPAP